MAAILGSLLIGGVIFAIRIRSLTGQAETKRLVLIQALTAEAAAREDLRPVLRGNPVPGNSWDDYLQAATELHRLGNDDLRLRAFVTFGRDGRDWSALNKLNEAHPTILDALRRGTHRERSRNPAIGVVASGIANPCLQLQGMTLLAQARARQLSSEGRYREAMELWLDLAMVGRDVEQNPPGPWMMDSEHFKEAFAGLKEMVQGPHLSQEDLTEMARELAILDTMFPSLWATLRNHQLFVRSSLVQREIFLSMGSGYRSANHWDTWRYGFSQRLMLLRGVEDIDGWVERFAGIDEGPYAEVVELGAKFSVERSFGNPVLRSFSPEPSSLVPKWRNLRTQLRLLRGAAHYRATGEVLEMPDPYGTSFRHSQKGVTLKIWSVGPDGVDDGGLGGWDSAKGKDIVLEVER
ncbi:MAG TPA: hypothetical protein VE981_22285 [Planctomycetota bacterium]|nr:hypothetical protein [Planctomycetota bacterium]